MSHSLYIDYFWQFQDSAHLGFYGENKRWVITSINYFLFQTLVIVKKENIRGALP